MSGIAIARAFLPCWLASGLTSLLLFSAVPEVLSGQQAQPVTNVQELAAFGAEGAPGTTTAGLQIEVAAEPAQPMSGDVIELAIVVSNRSGDPVIFEVVADLQRMLFVGGSDGASPAAQPTQEVSEVSWPSLRLEPYQSGRLELRAVSLMEEGDLSAGIQLMDFGEGEQQRIEWSATPTWPEGRGRVSWAAFLSGIAASVAIGLLAGVPWAVWAWPLAGGGPRAGCLSVALVTLTTLLGLALVAFASEDLRRFTSYEKTTCTVRDRLFVGADSTSNRTAGTRQSKPAFRPLIAVELSVAGGPLHAVWGDYDGGGVLSGDREWVVDRLEQFELGESYPCWFDRDRPRDVDLLRDVQLLPYLALIGLLLLAVLPSVLVRRRSARSPGASGLSSTFPPPSSSPKVDSDPEPVRAPPLSSQAGVDRYPLRGTLVLQAAEKALEKQGPGGLLLRQGEHIYVDASLIQDPSERSEARDLLRRLGEDADVSDILALAKLLARHD